MAEKTFWLKYGFERTVWANMELAKLCPGKNIQRIDDMLASSDTEEQFDTMINIIQIMNKAYIRKYSKLEPDKEYNAVTREELLDLDEEELANLALLAMGKFYEDGKVTVLAEPKKEAAEETESSSTTAGSSTSATSLE